MMSHHPGKVQVWSYEWAPAHALKGSLLDHLSTEGTSCAGALCAHCEGNAVRRLPLLIVCHGLGGVVFKKVWFRPSIEHSLTCANKFCQ